MSDSETFGQAGLPPLGPPQASFEPSATPAGAPERASAPAWGRRRTLAAATVLAGALAAAAAGAAVGHEFWTTTPAASSAALGALPAGASHGSVANGLPSDPFNGFAEGGVGRSFSGFAGSSATTPGAGAPSNAAAIAAKVNGALVDINSSFGYESGAGAGTGIVLTANGEVLTNNHVIDGATKVTATDIGNGKTYTATVVGYDPSHDIAILQLQGASGLQSAQLGDSSKLKVGEPIVALGNAGGAGGTPSFAAGSITSIATAITASDEIGGMSERLSNLIQTNADIQPGDSGGPLVNSQGQVIGMDTAASVGFRFDTTTSQAFAIPVNQAIVTAAQIEAGHASSAVHVGPAAFLGVEVAPAVGSGGGFAGNGGFGGFAGSQGSSSGSVAGVAVSGVLAGLPAERAGIVAGDVITAIDGHSVSSEQALSAAMLARHPGEATSISWTDGAGRSHTATVTLASGPPA